MHIKLRTCQFCLKSFPATTEYFRLSGRLSRFCLTCERNPICIRRAREKWTDTFTPKDWGHCLSYFNHSCAVCGRQLNGLFGDFFAAADHWIPVAKGGLTTRTNIVPLCHGVGGCNNSKNDSPADVWLVKRYGKRKAYRIMHRVQQYFNSLDQAA